MWETIDVYNTPMLIVIATIGLYFGYIYGRQVIRYYNNRNTKSFITYLYFLISGVGHILFILFPFTVSFGNEVIEPIVEIVYIEEVIEIDNSIEEISFTQFGSDTWYMCTKQYDIQVCEVLENN